MKLSRVSLAFVNAILFVILVASVYGNVWNSFYSQSSPVSCEKPKVTLQSGTAGTSTIYANSTSAKASAAAPLWLSGWDKRIRITIDNNDVDSDLSNFPILVHLSNSSGRNNNDVTFVFDELQNETNRKKIAVTTNDGITQCYAEIEKWYAASERAWLWVKVPSVGSTIDTSLYLYYDKDHTDNTIYVGDTNSTTAENVWDSNYKGVWHLQQDPSGTAPQMLDSTSNNLDMTSEGTMTSDDQVTGNIDGSLDFDGTDDDLKKAATAGSDPWEFTGSFALSAWFKFDVEDKWHYIVSSYKTTVPLNGYHFGVNRIDATTSRLRFIVVDSTAANRVIQSNTVIEPNTWYYGAGVFDNSNTQILLYLQGTSNADPITVSGHTASNQDLFHGVRNDKASGLFFDGIIDEVRISSMARSAAWIKASYESERDDLLDFGSEQKNIQDYVDNNTSNVDSSADKGTHSNFTAQQYGPDSTYDTLTEQNTSVTVNNWGITSSAFTSAANHTTYRYMGGTSPNVDNMTATKLHIRYSGTGTVAIALYSGGTLTDPIGATKRTEAYNVAVSAGWNVIDVPDYSWGKNTVTWIGWCHGGGSVYYSSSSGDAGDFQLPRGRCDQTTPSNADETSPMPTNPGSGSFSDYWYAVYVEYEAPNHEMELEVQWTNVDYNEPNEELAIWVDKGNTYSLDATGGYMIVGDGTPNWGSTTGTISFWINWDTVANRPWGQHDNMETRFSGSRLVLDWGVAGSITSRTSFTAGKWYFIAIVWNENTDSLYLYVGDQDSAPVEDSYLSGWTSTVSNVGVTQNNFMASRGGVNRTDGRGDDLRYWNIDRTLAQIQSNYNTEPTGSETNLRSYFKLNNGFDDIGPNNSDGSGSGSYSFSSNVPFDENILVDFWNGTSWQNLFTSLTNGWNNISVSSYLTTSNFTIRFKGDTETSDITQDSWKVDATLLHIWKGETYDHVLKAVNQIASNWTINLQVYDTYNINRLSSLNITFHDGTSSNQIAISNGAIIKSEGEPYNLPAGSGLTIYISLNNLRAITSGNTYLYVYLKIRVPNTSIYNFFIITFEIT